jgi:DNA-binding transcriptional MerR regulator
MRAVTKVATGDEPAEKLFYKIGEVAEIVGVKPYVLRFWESEFTALRPAKSKSQHRLYRAKDVATVRQIKHLLHDERMTIEGAKRRLREIQKTDQRQAELALDDRRYRTALVRIRKELEAIHRILA